ncbi:MAG: 3-phosphoserine/phosphohydroxythreonine transaminase [Acidobacteria bacterium]|nr:MAG: 3-phosphoserine/phosphohydroxythreonine transaminase [Acidobacteriota bacterium]REK07397.1 MAG: 3-phosphoserine/phosphohydroxythreonine transaminase [Acidobacteriota bacterium]
MIAGERVFNFSSGPAVMPLEVLRRAAEELPALPGVGMSVMEISHRSRWADEIFAETEARLRRVLSVPDDYRVLFLQGGGSLQFSMVPINYLRRDASADYLLTGYWGRKAIAEARREGTVHVAWSGEGHRFDRMPVAPEELELDPEAAYVHVTSNETIQGVQFPGDPLAGVDLGAVPLVCDGSSDFLSRPIDVSHYGLLYACAQKNAGPAGLSIVVVSDALLERGKQGLHSMLDYRRHAEAGSRYNTPPVFAVYLFRLVLEWLEDRFGGLERLGEHNRRKAELLYAALDEHADYYRGHARPEFRSSMNVTFRTPDEDTDRAFLRGAEELGMHQLAGHRSVGGVRASIYNAMPLAGVERLAEYLHDFRRRSG